MMNPIGSIVVLMAGCILLGALLAVVVMISRGDE
jgi:hypothetical protein